MTTNQQSADPLAERLAEEIRALTHGPGSQVTFSADIFEAYSLVAVLQLASRHPHLSDVQLRIVLGLAHDIADSLTTIAQARFGETSAIALALAMGYEPQFDLVHPMADHHG